MGVVGRVFVIEGTAWAKTQQQGIVFIGTTKNDTIPHLRVIGKSHEICISTCFFFFLKFLFILFLAVLGLCCCTGAFLWLW